MRDRLIAMWQIGMRAPGLNDDARAILERIFALEYDYARP